MTKNILNKSQKFSELKNVENESIQKHFSFAARKNSNSIEIDLMPKIKEISKTLKDDIIIINDMITENISQINIRNKYIKKLKDSVKSNSEKIIEKSHRNSHESSNSLRSKVYQCEPIGFEIKKKDNIPRWLPDKIAKFCKECNTKFNFFNRKHHCRVCGDIFCGDCCNYYERFLPHYTKKVRMCKDCFRLSRVANK